MHIDQLSSFYLGVRVVDITSDRLLNLVHGQRLQELTEAAPKQSLGRNAWYSVTSGKERPHDAISCSEVHREVGGVDIAMVQFRLCG